MGPFESVPFEVVPFEAEPLPSLDAMFEVFGATSSFIKNVTPISSAAAAAAPVSV